MYHAAETGNIELALDMRNLGVPWTLYTWLQTLHIANEKDRDSWLSYLHLRSKNLRFCCRFINEISPILVFWTCLKITCSKIYNSNESQPRRDVPNAEVFVAESDEVGRVDVGKLDELLAKLRKGTR